MTATKKYFNIENMDFIMKSVLMILMIVYLIMPIDLMPGPIDDAIVLLLGTLVNVQFDKLDKFSETI